MRLHKMLGFDVAYICTPPTCTYTDTAIDLPLTDWSSMNSTEHHVKSSIHGENFFEAYNSTGNST